MPDRAVRHIHRNRYFNEKWHIYKTNVLECTFETQVLVLVRAKQPQPRVNEKFSIGEQLEMSLSIENFFRGY
ncbi:hypothetical protein MTR_0049s0080 [Medicago truncatula]|uniref:Uncharacterized protein n=1 Tax=Medicago truncatula TaxID=3880 RepID=A0A072THM0_MEDTR|nr:hypothetical protein MTR_0049s0080 [Medicago truncatula]